MMFATTDDDVYRIGGWEGWLRSDQGQWFLYVVIAVCVVMLFFAILEAVNQRFSDWWLNVRFAGSDWLHDRKDLWHMKHGYPTRRLARRWENRWDRIRDWSHDRASAIGSAVFWKFHDYRVSFDVEVFGEDEYAACGRRCPNSHLAQKGTPK